MSKKKPIKIELNKGKYSWCGCGKSQNLPLCDDHSLLFCKRSVEIVLEADQHIILCSCSLTNSPPFCDGSHKIFNE
tara:strand:+ start:1607 stop:1834 length:228 start_codon:yes stop_codon:yes gene_type:complete